uniref:NAD-dependent epimerase/dehydratase domain-containing protein n=2 Tax=Aegilops tauschii subsp. strangulata TaxID=200361 RepID=A0A453RVX8_AEGTS
MSGHAPGGGDLGRLRRRAQPGMAGRGGPRRALLDQHRLLRPEQGCAYDSMIQLPPHQDLKILSSLEPAPASLHGLPRISTLAAGAWYPASNTLAEKAAWKFEEENGLHVVVVNPGTILGSMIPPRINASMAIFLHLLEGTRITIM